jgi:hypothetical protein
VGGDLLLVEVQGLVAGNDGDLGDVPVHTDAILYTALLQGLPRHAGGGNLEGHRACATKMGELSIKRGKRREIFDMRRMGLWQGDSLYALLGVQWRERLKSVFSV